VVRLRFLATINELIERSRLFDSGDLVSYWPFASLRSRPLSDQHRTHAESRSVANDPNRKLLKRASC
jgi:hypothetical protein